MTTTKSSIHPAAVSRHFLGWERPVLDAVVDFLVPGRPGRCTDLGDCFVVVPTRQAGRRLRRALFERCAAAGGGLLPPVIETPAWFTDPARAGRIAAPAAELACWHQLLDRIDRRAFPELFAGRAEGASDPLVEARLFYDLRRLLAEGGYDFARVAATVAVSGTGEVDLWQDLARLEEEYRRFAAERQVVDTVQLAVELADDPRLPAGVRRLVVAAVPDPIAILPRILERLPVPVDILVHAPAHLADAFDQWGRPRVEVWRQRPLPLDDDAIVVGADPSDQAQRIMAELGRADPSIAQTAICIADAEVSRPLISLLAEAGVTAYDPAGTSLARHPLFVLLDRLRRLVVDGDAEAATAVIRHPDLLAALEGDREIALSPARVLAALDATLARAVPATFDDLCRAAAGVADLAPACALLQSLHRQATTRDPLAALDTILETIFAHRRLDPDDPDDALFMQAARRLRTLIAECRPLADWGMGFGEIVGFLLERARSVRLYAPGEGADLELEGWLEAPWVEVPFLVVAGMNEGRVPAPAAVHPYVPDGLAASLGLPHADRLLARDAFLLAGLAAARRAGGRLVLTLGRWSAAGDPLLPSRLFFLADDEDLAGRAERLFAPVIPAGTGAPPSLAFAYDLRRKPPPPPPARLSVVAIRDYLRCPFRYFLRHHCNMVRSEPLVDEIDPATFGALAHGALHAMGRDAAIWACGDAGRIRRFFEDWLAREARRRFGPRPTTTVAWQLEALGRRLAACARYQAELAADWQIVAVEEKVEMEVDGVCIQGRIDRIDRHRRTGVYRIIDYKTGDTAQDPAAAHLAPPGPPPRRDYTLVQVGGRTKRWVDLQLPLYRLLAADLVGDAPVELAYWVMPKALSDTGILVWDDFGADLLNAARLCLAGVIAELTARIFWPPAPKVEYDEFEDLFLGEAADCFLLPDWMKGDDR